MAAVTTPAKPTTMAALKVVPKRIKKHNSVVIAAGIAFYGLLALVPTLIALISIYALVTDADEIARQITDLTKNLEDRNTAELLSTQVSTAAEEAKGSSGITALTIGILLALFSASGAVAKLMATVSAAYEAVETRKGWKVRGLAFLFTAGAIVGVVILGTLLGAMPVLANSVFDLGQAGQVAVTIASAVAAFGAMIFGFTVLYRYGPDRQNKTPWKNPGAIVATIAFLLFVMLFNLYFRLAGSMPASYGILGTIAALIIFLQLITIAILLGAEVNAAVEESRAVASGQGIATVAGSSAAGGSGPTDYKPAEPMPLGKAIAGLAALFVLGKGDD